MNRKTTLLSSRIMLILLIFTFPTVFRAMAQYPPGSPLDINGKLEVNSTYMVNTCGYPIQLRGMSTHGLQWFGNCINQSSVSTMVTDWNIDVLRLAMYIQEGGYVTNPSYYKTRIDELVDICEAQGIYVVIDFHVHIPGDPMEYINEAREFWQYMSQKHAGKEHVIYEICNEPSGVNWPRIKEYANEIIPLIRANDPENIIICGTPTWSQEVDVAALDPLNYDNIMYAFHFYAGTHGDDVRQKAETAIQRGAAIIATEWGTVDVLGQSTPEPHVIDGWLDWCAENKISWMNWSYCDKDESSAALKPGSCNSGQWNNTSASGSYIKARLQNDPNPHICKDTVINPNMQRPFLSSPHQIPGIIQAEDFDNGGQGISFFDNSTENSGRSYRPTAVDIERTKDESGDFNIGFIDSGEWLEYSVDVTQSGNYQFNLRAAANRGNNSISISIDSSGSTTLTIPETGGWQSWSTITGPKLFLEEGIHIIRLDFVTGGYNLNYLDVVPDLSGNIPPEISLTLNSTGDFYAPAELSFTAQANDPDGVIGSVVLYQDGQLANEGISSPYNFTLEDLSAGTYSFWAIASDSEGATNISDTISVVINETVNNPEQSPFAGSPIPIPGIIQFENYDEGGQDISFYDVDMDNRGRQYRTDQVDIERCRDIEGGFNIGFISSGEWLEYSIDVQVSGFYSLETRYASNSGQNMELQYLIDEVPIEQPVLLNNSGGWQTWESVNQEGVYLTEGIHVLRAEMLTGGYNLNYLKATLISEDNENELPTVEILSPIDGDSILIDGEDIQFIVQSNDPDGYVVSYDLGIISDDEFILIKTVDASSDTIPFFTISDNVFNFLVIATDNSGGKDTSSITTITTVPPQLPLDVYLTEPANQAIYDVDSPIPFRLSTSYVMYFPRQDASLIIFGDTTLTITVPKDIDEGFLPALNTGEYSIYASVPTEGGPTGYSDTNTFVVSEANIPPVTEVISPASGDSIALGPDNFITVQMLVSAYDPDGNIVRYEVGVIRDNEYQLFKQTNALSDELTFVRGGKGSSTYAFVAVDNDGGRDTSFFVLTFYQNTFAPQITINQPANDESIFWSQDFTVITETSDPDENIASVTFSIGGTDIYTDFSPPYEWTTSFQDLGLLFGTHSIVATVLDEDGLSDSETVTLNIIPVNQPGLISSLIEDTVFINDPIAGVNFAVDVSDPYETLDRVVFNYPDGRLIEAFDSPPFETTIAVSSGSYSVDVEAIYTDDYSVQKRIEFLVIELPNTPPTIVISGLENNSSIPASIEQTILIEAVDEDGALSGVNLFLNGDYVGAFLSETYEYTFSNLEPGDYTFIAEATDNEGAVSTSEPLFFTVIEDVNTYCDEIQVPTTSEFLIRSPWSDQYNGSETQNGEDALKIIHRQWGATELYVIKYSDPLALVNGSAYEVSFDFLNSNPSPASAISVGFMTGYEAGNGSFVDLPVFIGDNLSSTEYTTVSGELVATTDEIAAVAIILNFAGQPRDQVEAYIKNFSICEPSSIARFGSAPLNKQTTLAPNPFQNYFSLQVQYKNDVPLTVQILNSKGEIVSHDKIYTTNRDYQVGNELSPGLYIVKILYADQVESYKLVKY